MKYLLDTNTCIYAMKRKLIENNIKEFERVSGLRPENWWRE